MENIKEKMIFGKLTVLSFVEKRNYRNFWLCRCECGTERIVREDHLLEGRTASCGCCRNKPSATRLSLEGKRFGKLTVISFAEIRNGMSYWNCKCDCGNTCTACGKLLVRGTTKSCGCLKHSFVRTKKRAFPAVSDNKELAKEFGRTEGALYLAKRKLFGEYIAFLNSEQKETLKAYFASNQNRKESDLKLLSEEMKRSYQTVYDTKIKLFGKNIPVLSEEQREQMKKYFEQTEKWGTSVAEKEVVDFIRSIYKGEVTENDRSAIYPKELDVYVPEKKFAVEYDGLFWHSEGGECFADYHLKKTSECMKRGIRLLHVYENEWRDKQDIVKSMIASALGIYVRREYARNLKVKEVTDKKVAVDFFEANHIQGAVHKFSLCLGLFKGEELLQAVVFGKQHFGKNGETELYRMVTKKNCQVVGGFSKLMEHSPYDNVVSYVALRMFDGKGYLAGKWKIEHQSEPSFCLTDGVNVYSRHLFKKSKCKQKFKNVSEDMTEKEMQLKNGLYRLWDCGTFKVRWKR